MNRILFIILLLVNVMHAKGNAFNIYADGIYDAYIQINRDIQAGIEERTMHEYRGKYLVALPVDDVSTVKIIFYKTVGAKNSLTPAVVMNTNSGKSFLVFDTFNRKANAVALKHKLSEYGLDGVSIYGKADIDTYKRNPVVIKKLINDLKETIKDTTVRVVKIESSVGKYKSLPLSHVSKRKSIHKKENQIEKNNADDFLKLRKDYCSYGFMKNNKIFLYDKKISLGQRLGSFKINKITEDKDLYVAILKGEDGKNYKLKDQWCDRKQKTKVTVTAKKTNKISKVKKTYVCNFTKIPIVILTNGKKKRTKETGYGVYDQATINIYEEKESKYKIRGMGENYIFVTKKSFNKNCIEKS